MKKSWQKIHVFQNQYFYSLSRHTKNAIFLTTQYLLKQFMELYKKQNVEKQEICDSDTKIR